MIAPIRTLPAPTPAPQRVPTDAELKLKQLLAWHARYGHMSQIATAAGIYPA